MNAHEFYYLVFGLRRKHLAKCDTFLSKLVSEKIKHFSPSKDAYRLKGLLLALYCECKHFETNFNKNQLYTSITNGFLNFQKIL